MKKVYNKKKTKPSFVGAVMRGKCSIKFFFLMAVSSAFLFSAQVSGGEEYAVPNSGSPYVSPEDLRDNEILHVPTGLVVSKEQLLDTVSDSRVIYVGETHDNLEAHRVQLEALRGLNERFPGKVAVGMEMFRRSAQPQLDRWNRGALPLDEFKKLFYQNWGPGFEMYRPIFDYLRAHNLPLVGLKSSKETEAVLRREGTGAPGLPEMDLGDSFHKQYALSIFGGHSSEGVSNKPYEMLTLWEEAMAQSVAQFLDDPARRDFKLVVLAGGFHVQYGFGIPKRAFRRKAHAFSVVLPTVVEMPEELKASREMKTEQVSIPLYSADFVWRVAYRVPQENKIRLGVALREAEDGIQVRSVVKNSNADQAGVLEGDVLLGLDGESLADVADLIARLQIKSFGDTAVLKLRRNRLEHELPVLLRPPNP